MKSIGTLLEHDEQILTTSRPHLLVFISQMLTGLALIAVLVSAGIISSRVFAQQTDIFWMGLAAHELLMVGIALISVLVLVSLFHTFLNWNAQQVILTNQRILQINGHWEKTVVSSPLASLDALVTRQTFLGRLFHYGTIEIATGADENTIVLEDIRQPLEMKRLILDAKHHYDHGYGYFEMPGPQPVVKQGHPAPIDFELRRALEDLARLRDRGILSTEEFERKKRELLTRV